MSVSLHKRVQLCDLDHKGSEYWNTSIKNFQEFHQG